MARKKKKKFTVFVQEGGSMTEYETIVYIFEDETPLFYFYTDTPIDIIDEIFYECDIDIANADTLPIIYDTGHREEVVYYTVLVDLKDKVFIEDLKNSLQIIFNVTLQDLVDHSNEQYKDMVALTFSEIFSEDFEIDSEIEGFLQDRSFSEYDFDKFIARERLRDIEEFGGENVIRFPEWAVDHDKILIGKCVVLEFPNKKPKATPKKERKPRKPKE